MNPLSASLDRLLGRVRVLPRRLYLDTGDVQTTTPMLRGVWGAALHDLDETAYSEVFHPHENAAPLYLLRPVVSDLPVVDYFLFGGATAHDATLLRAWDIASGMGLGSHRERFHIRKAVFLSANGAESPDLRPSEASFSLRNDGLSAVSRIRFVSPVRLVRNGRAIKEPTLGDLALSLVRRAEALSGETKDGDLHRTVLAEASRVGGVRFEGEVVSHVRYSGRQKDEIRMDGAVGCLETPEGVGLLAPLLCAGEWMHAGKSSIVGLGEIRIE